MTAARLLAPALLFMAFSARPAGAGDAFQLSLPIDCEPHRTCFIQTYFDVDPGPGAKDYACGEATSDKHDGIDFRIMSALATKAGVGVRAAAPGRVKALREGMEDVFYSEAKASEIKNRECGNGVVIDHGDGWETQYCHLLKGSIAVQRGQEVKRGDRLGNVGYSGEANFAHLHLTVRKNGNAVDPFAPDAAPGTCRMGGGGIGQTTLWEPAMLAHFAYRNGEIIATGFAAAPPDFHQLEADHTAVVPLDADSPALLFYARFINLLAGDRVRLVINGPGGPLVEQLSEPLDRNKTTYLSYAGKKGVRCPGSRESMMRGRKSSGTVR